MPSSLIFLLLFFSSVSTRLPPAPNYISHLPGLEGKLPSRLETGYVTVDRRHGEELFYYFIESEREPSKDPVLLWLTGGPGCTSFSALSMEIGPVRFKIVPYVGTLPTLVHNPYTWTKVSNIIFLDWPPRSGFSLSRRNKDCILNDATSMKQIYRFIREWFLDHPEFLSNPFYVAGDSFGGKMAALVAYKIAKGIEAADQPLINLKGYLIGNPRTGNNKFDFNSRVPHSHGLGIISDELFESLQRNCAGEEDYWHPKNTSCAATLHVFNEVLNEFSLDNILLRKCKTKTLWAKKRLQETRVSLSEERFSKLFSPPPTDADIKCARYLFYLAYYWANDNFTRQVLGVKEGTVEEWQVCNTDIRDRYTEAFVPSCVPHHRYLTSHGYRALIYSGDHDMTIPFIGTMEWIRSLDLPVIESWRSWHLNGQVAGYTEKYGNNLTFATVLGVGHEAPQDKPKQCFAMFERWIAHESL